jgi:hypothetical protein
MRSIIHPRDFVAHPVPVNGPQDRMDRLATVTLQGINRDRNRILDYLPL